MLHKDVMPFERFAKIMNTILDFRAKRDRVNDFFEKELTEDSWCIFTYGNPLEDTLIHMLADEFDCWFQYGDQELSKEWWTEKRIQDNDISYWIYDLDGEEPKKMVVNGESIPVDTLEEFYEYLIKYWNKDIDKS